MLEKVKKLSSEASVTKESKKDGNILIHHSRDTAEKQWAETQVLSLAGVARVFNNKRRVLQSLGKRLNLQKVVDIRILYCNIIFLHCTDYLFNNITYK